VSKMVNLELSEKALMLVEKRRGDRSIGQYISMILENISDKMSTPRGPGGVNLFDLLETKTHAATAGGKAPEVLKQMRTVYPDKIPYNIFRQECAERGVPGEDIDAVVAKHKDMFQAQQNRDEEYAKLLLVVIFNYLKDFYSKSMSTSQFYAKCLEECLTVDDIRFAENIWQVSIPDVDTLRGLAAKTDSMSAENKLLRLFYGVKKEYPDTIPTSVLQARCIQIGLTKDDIGQLEKSYTRYLLTKHNARTVASAESSGAKPVVDIAAKVKEINARVKHLIDELVAYYGENIPVPAFLFKCKQAGLTGEEQLYAKRVFEDYQESLASYKDIKYMNSKAYIILTSLRKVYPGKIPYNVFYNKCKAIGLKNDEILEALKQSGKIITTDKNEQEHYLKTLDNIITDVRGVKQPV